jgi:hypothetical protein
MRWLVRLICPPGGIVLDPFAGSFTTGVACILEGLDFIGIEQEEDYIEIGRRRMAFAQANPGWWNATGEARRAYGRTDRGRSGSIDGSPLQQLRILETDECDEQQG